jgi:hypothetical protein
VGETIGLLVNDSRWRAVEPARRREEDGLRVWDPIMSSLRRAMVSGTSCEKREEEIEAAKREERLQKKGLRRWRGERRADGGEQRTHTHRRLCEAPE